MPWYSLLFQLTQSAYHVKLLHHLNICWMCFWLNKLALYLPESSEIILFFQYFQFLMKNVFKGCTDEIEKCCSLTDLVLSFCQYIHCEIWLSNFCWSWCHKLSKMLENHGSATYHGFMLQLDKKSFSSSNKFYSCITIAWKTASVRSQSSGNLSFYNLSQP